MKKSVKILLILLAMLLILTAAAAVYALDYYRADAQALAALRTDGEVRVAQTDYGWLFDGPSEENALIFYPGGKVEETAYAPLLHELAARGMDVCLVKMPLRLALLWPARAELPLAEHDYENWYIGGHSLGGVAASIYAAGHPGDLDGLVLLAAYPTKPLDEALRVITVCGTEDGVIDAQKLAEAARYLPADALFCEIEGGNHAQFGSYGPQQGDGEAAIEPEEQWEQTAELLASLPER